MRLPRLIVLSVAALAATGCATTTYVAALPNVSANCVDTLQAVTARPLGYLPTEAKARKAALQPVEFATVSTCLRGADAGPVPVALYRFDGVAAPAEVNVAVTLSPGGTFAAKVEVLDAMLQPVQSYGFDKFTRRGSTYSLNVFLNDTNRQPGYLLISPDRAQVGKSDTIVGSQTNAVVIPTGGAIYYGTETMTVRPFLEGGMVLVTAQPQVSAGFTSDAR